MADIRVRRETSADHARVFEIHEAAFGGPAEARLVELLRAKAQPQISLVAEAQTGDLVGHIFFSPVEVPGPRGRRAAIGLAPVAVDPSRQRAGVGSKLCRAGIDACRERGEPAVFVLGHSAYYPRFGFEPARPHGLFYKSENFDASFFVLELTPGTLAELQGEVVYLPEFEHV